jgi:hypothetical protein
LHEAWSILRSEGDAFGVMSSASGARLEVQVHWSDLVELLTETPTKLSFRYDRQYPWEAATMFGQVRVCALLTDAQKDAAEQDGLALAEEVIA